MSQPTRDGHVYGYGSPAWTSSTSPQICTHQWIDPEDPLMERAPYSPVIGSHRREMKPGRLYRCNNCHAVLLTPKPAPPGGSPP